MAQPAEPMDTDDMSDFDNKENSLQHSNVLSRSTEKGYEELDVSELNMKLRYSLTPVSSPIIKSSNRTQEAAELNSTVPVVSEGSNLDHSLSLTNIQSNSTKILKSLPLQSLPLVGTDALESQNNVTVMVTGTNDIQENISFPSSSSSLTDTPEPTTPVLEVPKPSGSPILRGLKSVLSMFRSSQSPIPPDERQTEEEVSSPPVVISPVSNEDIDGRPETLLSSTPLSTNRRDCTKKGSPLKESLVFNDDLEKELAWKDETTILFSKEKIPIHKLFFQQPNPSTSVNKPIDNNNEQLDSTVEPMDVSFNNSTLKDHIVTDSQLNNISNVNDKHVSCGNIEKDESVFLDCETTFSMDISQAQDATKENTETNLNTSLTSQVAKQDETNMSMFSAEFQPELEEINAFSDDKNALENVSPAKLGDFKVNLLVTDDLAPLPKNQHYILPTSALPNEIIEDVINGIKDLNSLVHNKGEGEDLDTDEVPESIQKTLEDTWNRIDGTQCFDDTVDVINRLEEAIRQQDDEFMEAPSNFEKESFETSLATLVNNMSSKDMTDSSDQSLNITVKDLDAVDSSKPDKANISDNVQLQNESIETQNKINLTITAELKHDIAETATKVDPLRSVKTNTLKTLPILEDILKKDATEICNTTTEIDYVPDNIIQTSENVSEGELSEFCKDEYVAVPLSDKKQPIGSVAQETPVINITFPEPSKINESGALNSAVSSDVEALSIEDSFIAADHIEESLDVDQTKEDKNCDTTVVNENKKIYKSLVEQDADTKMQDIYDVQGQNQVFNIVQDTSQQKEQPIPNNTNTTTATELIPSKSTPFQETKQNQDQEIVMSESNSPFVSLSTEDEDLSDTKDRKRLDNEQIECNPVPDIDNQLLSQPKAVSPPLSPRLPGKSSYNFNFDEMDDPFAMNGKVRMSPIPVDSKETIGTAVVTSVVNNFDKKTNKTSTCQNVTSDDVAKVNITVNLDASLPQVPPINELQPNIITDVVAVKTDLTFNINNLHMTNDADQSDICGPSVSTYIPTEGVDQTLNVKEAETIKVINASLDKTENDVSKLCVGGSPPLSPRLSGKGAYNFNFDEMDDPFDSLNKPSTFSSPDRVDTILNALGTANTSIDNTISQLSPKVNATLNENNSTKELVKDNIPIGIYTPVAPQPFDPDETKIADGKAKIEDEVNELYEEAKDDISEKEQESLDDFAMEENKISAELNGTLQENIKATSTSKHSMYVSAGMSSSEGAYENLVENSEDSNNQLGFKSIDMQLPETQFVAGNDNLEDKIVGQDLASEQSAEDNLATGCEDRDGSETNYSESSKTTDEKDVTIKEVLTEDEDTVEGPFIEAQLSVDSEKVTPLYSDPAKTALGTDINQFTDLPAQPNDDNFEAGEMFIDADAFEFLMNQNKSNELDENGKESLFLKFDPLFAKRVNSDGIVDALTKLQKRQSTPKKIKPVPRDLMSLDKSPVAGPSNVEMSLDESNVDMHVTVSQKPTMVVPPAVNPVPTPRQTASTPTRANRLSMNFTSPAMAVIDRLLSMSTNNSMVGQDTPSQISREHIEADRALTQFRELLAEKEGNVHQLRCENKDLRNRLATMESQVSNLESETDKRLKNIEDLNKKLDEREKINKNMASVVEEYERTISGLITGIEEDKKLHAEERMQLIKERDEQSAHLLSMEVAFNDLHSKYEKSKQIIFSYKAKEDIYRKSIKEFEDNLSKMEKNYESLKQHATSKLNFANQELEKINKSHESEVLKLTAMMKRKDLHISSLEETLAQKSKANEELTAICDELINKVG